MNDQGIKSPLALMTGKSGSDIPANVKKRVLKVFKKPFPMKDLAKWIGSKVKT